MKKKKKSRQFTGGACASGFEVYLRSLKKWSQSGAVLDFLIKSISYDRGPEVIGP